MSWSSKEHLQSPVLAFRKKAALYGLCIMLKNQMNEKEIVAFDSGPKQLEVCPRVPSWIRNFFWFYDGLPLLPGNLFWRWIFLWRKTVFIHSEGWTMVRNITLIVSDIIKPRKNTTKLIYVKILHVLIKYYYYLFLNKKDALPSHGKERLFLCFELVTLGLWWSNLTIAPRATVCYYLFLSVKKLVGTLCEISTIHSKLWECLNNISVYMRA